MGPPDTAQVDHCAVIGHLHRLANAGLATFQHLELVHSVFHTQGQDFVPRKPLPGALVVKKRGQGRVSLQPRPVSALPVSAHPVGGQGWEHHCAEGPPGASWDR